MSKEIRELEENSKRIIENMRPQTIAQVSYQAMVR